MCSLHVSPAAPNLNTAREHLRRAESTLLRQVRDLPTQRIGPKALASLYEVNWKLGYHKKNEQAENSKKPPLPGNKPYFCAVFIQLNYTFH